MPPVVINFAEMDSMKPKMEMNYNVNIIEILHRNAKNIKKALVLGD